MAPFTITTTLPLILLLPSLILAQSTAGPCVSNCGFISSFCDGDETGAALDDCKCSTFSSNAVFISCIKACPETEVAKYAGLVPEKCREQLFPGVAAVSPSSSSAGDGATATTTRSMTEETESSITTAQSTAATATTGRSSGSAGVRNALAWPGAAAALGGALAVIALY
jgi:hypothetical protein